MKGKSIIVYLCSCLEQQPGRCGRSINLYTFSVQFIRNTCTFMGSLLSNQLIMWHHKVEHRYRSRASVHIQLQNEEHLNELVYGFVFSRSLL